MNRLKKKWIRYENIILGTKLLKKIVQKLKKMMKFKVQVLHITITIVCLVDYKYCYYSGKHVKYCFKILISIDICTFN